MKNNSINALVANNSLLVFGYPAFKELESISNKNGDQAVLSMLPAGVVLDAGYDSFFAPVQPRFQTFNSAQEILDAGIPVIEVFAKYVTHEDVSSKPAVIVSRHTAATDLLLEQFPQLVGAPIVTGLATEEDIKNKVVFGTIPTHMALKAAALVSVTVPGYDASKMSDLSADQLKEHGLNMVVKQPIVMWEKV